MTKNETETMNGLKQGAWKITENITLFIFGGVAQMRGEPSHPKADFRIAVAGPVASFILAGIFFFLKINTSDLGLKSIFSYVSNINLILEFFNLIPGLPMDGEKLKGMITRNGIAKYLEVKGIVTKIEER